MDGSGYFPAIERSQHSSVFGAQRTIKSAIGCAGVGLHTGAPAAVRLVPAPEDHGLVFLRTDLGIAIPATFDHVVDTRLCTVIGHGAGRVGTVEHLMAALVAAGIDNAVIEVDGPELPVLDGSAEPWLFLIDCAGAVDQSASRHTIEVLRTVRVTDGDAYAELRPGHGGLAMALTIEFEAGAIGRQSLTLDAHGPAVRRELARARTFALKHDIEGLQQAGLARGGSLDNAVVVDGAHVLNPAGLRMADEFVRHKLLDAVGDLGLAGGALQGRFVGHKSGHGLNNGLLRALFADAANWSMAAPAGVLLAA